ncbi:hypothetical protein GMMP15_80062 [Candidatus Magnetomoraceae bacterium gMMP-15]
MLKNIEQKGALLLGLVITLILVSFLASAIGTLMTGSAYVQAGSNNLLKAYYLAESGDRCALFIKEQFEFKDLKIQEVFQNSKTFNIGSESFTLQSRTRPAQTGMSPETEIVSTGIVKADVIGASRMVTYRFLKDDTMYEDDPPTADGKRLHADTKLVIDKEDEADTMILSENTEDNGALISLDWQLGLYNIPDLSKWWDGTLSYGLQVKIKIPSGKKHYMVGFSFRLSPESSEILSDDACYGISFFRSTGRLVQDTNGNWIEDITLPDWMHKLNKNFFKFDNEEDGYLEREKPYIILWYKEKDSFEDDYYKLMAYRKLEDIPNNANFLRGNNLKAWSTLMLEITENRNSKINYMSGFVQGQEDDENNSVYPRNSIINWENSNFIKNEWFSLKDETLVSTPYDDGTFLTETFGANRPDEIGIHAFCDSGDKVFFDDFAMKCIGQNCPTPPEPGVSQYEPIQY